MSDQPPEGSGWGLPSSQPADQTQPTGPPNQPLGPPTQPVGPSSQFPAPGGSGFGPPASWGAPQEPGQMPSSFGTPIAGPAGVGPGGFGPGGFDPTALLSPIPEPTPTWKRWWFIAAAIVVLGGIGAAVYVGTKDDADEQLSSQTTIPEISVPDITVPDVTIPEVPDFTIPLTNPNVPDLSLPDSTDPDETTAPTDETTAPTTDETTPSTGPSGGAVVIGQPVTLADGSIVRVDSVTPNAPNLDDFFTPTEGSSLTRLDVEACAGAAGYTTLNPFIWAGLLDDGSSADVFLFGGDQAGLGIAAGQCIRGLVDLEVPGGRTVAFVISRDQIFQESARWDVASTVAVEGPLQPPVAPAAPTAIGQSVAIGDGAKATVTAITPNAAPIEDFFPASDGKQLVQVAVELCAGPAELVVNGQAWFVAASDNRMGGATFSTTFADSSIAAGQCASGAFELELAADAVVRDVVYTGTLSDEVGRWRVAG